MKRLLPTLLITLCHALLTWLLFLQAFRLGMSRFDAGAPTTLTERSISAAAEIMMWPLCAPLLRWQPKTLNHLFPGLLGYIPLLLNSLLWALVIVWFWRIILAKKNGGGPTTPAESP